MKRKLIVCLLFAIVVATGSLTTTGFAADTAPAATVNLNQADAAELQSLPGIGPALADRIIAYRETEGPFKSVQQLADVKGVGPRKIEKFRERLTLE